MKKTVVALMMAVSVGISVPSFAAEPALHDVYQAANNGKLDDAQRMMKEVLQAHPNSAKAHYVEAELMAKQGNLKQVANELATAEKLAPGLPFAAPQAVDSLRQTVSRHASGTVAPAASPVQHSPLSLQPAHAETSFPWGMILLGLGLIAFIFWASKFMSRRNAPGSAGSTQPGLAAYRPAYPAGPYGGPPQGYGSPGAAPAAGPGLGSQMLGGLATGAAVGAGVVAGEALMHRFMDGNKAPPTNDRAFANFDSIPDLPSTPLNDMGGNDFGISDSASWDDASANESDWN